MKQYTVSKFESTLENYDSAPVAMSADQVIEAIHDYCSRNHCEIAPSALDFDTEEEARAFIESQPVRSYWTRSGNRFTLNVDAYELSRNTIDEYGFIEDSVVIDTFVEEADGEKNEYKGLTICDFVEVTETKAFITDEVRALIEKAIADDEPTSMEIDTGLINDTEYLVFENEEYIHDELIVCITRCDNVIDGQPCGKIRETLYLRAEALNRLGVNVGDRA